MYYRSGSEVGINSEYSLEGLMLKLQYLGHLIQRADSLEKMLILGKIWGQEEKGAIIGSMDMSLSKFREIAKDREA